MKLGFTSNIFGQPLKSGQVSLRELLALGKELGLKAMEIRDDEVSLSTEEVEALKKAADGLGIQLTYAIKNDLLTPGDEERFRKALDRACLLGEWTVMRMLLAQSVLKGKRGYAREEVGQLIGISCRYGSYAREKKVFMAPEHAREPLMGDGVTYFGLGEYLAGTCLLCEDSSAIKFTFDPANASNTSLCASPSCGEEVLGFLETFKSRIGLVHYKTTQGGAVQPVIGPADVDFRRLFPQLHKAFAGIFCLEIPGRADLDGTKSDLISSLKFLEAEGLFQYFS
jgi:sugar phosphate isomerase/epimerase